MPILAMLLMLVGGLLVPAVAGAQEQQLEPTIVVDSATTSAAAPAVSATTLQAGRQYLLVVNGTYTESFPTTDGGTFTYFNDGVYCFDENPERPQFGCRARPQIFERTGLILRLGSPGDGSPELLGPYYTKLPGPSTPPPYRRQPPLRAELHRGPRRPPADGGSARFEQHVRRRTRRRAVGHAGSRRRLDGAVRRLFARPAGPAQQPELRRRPPGHSDRRARRPSASWRWRSGPSVRTSARSVCGPAAGTARGGSPFLRPAMR